LIGKTAIEEISVSIVRNAEERKVAHIIVSLAQDIGDNNGYFKSLIKAVKINVKLI
jgi:hypothetical protein